MNIDTQELTGLGQPMPIKLSRIERYEDQPRIEFNDDDIKELADSIQSEGQHTPVTVCKHASKSGVFVLIGGERRWRAFHLIYERTGTEPLVKAFIDTVRDSDHHFRKALVDNLHRVDLMPLDEAMALDKLYNKNKMTVAEISKLIGKSITYVDCRIKLHNLPDKVKDMMRSNIPKEKQLSVTSAVEIARSTNYAEMRIELAREAVDRSLGVLEVRSLIQSRTGVSYDNRNRPGRKRRASDDHAVWRSNIERFLREIQVHTENFNVATIYDKLIDEDRERGRDLRTIEIIIKKLEDVKPKVSESAKVRFTRTGEI